MEEEKNKNFSIFGVIYIILASFNNLFYHILIEVKGNVIASIRILLMVIVLGLITTVSKKWKKIEKGEWLYMILGGALSFGLFTYCLAIGYQMTSLTQGTIIINLSPIFGMIFAVLFGLEKWNWSAFIGALVALSGVVICTTTAMSHGSGNLNGDILILISAIAISLGTVFTNKLGKRHHPFALTSILGFFGLLSILPFTYFNILDTSWGEISGNGYLMLIYIGVLGGAVAFGSYIKCIEIVGASAAMVYLFLGIPISILITIFILHKPVHLMQIVGAIIVIAGAGWSIYARKKSNSRIDNSHKHLNHV
ncbi:MAG TPA: DMT family transporter [Ignavibacteria bacterium]|nr:DMT family transporter [Ignavibacteria bacterium]